MKTKTSRKAHFDIGFHLPRQVKQPATAVADKRAQQPWAKLSHQRCSAAHQVSGFAQSPCQRLPPVSPAQSAILQKETTVACFWTCGSKIASVENITLQVTYVQHATCNMQGTPSHCLGYPLHCSCLASARSIGGWRKANAGKTRQMHRGNVRHCRWL